LCGIRQHAGAGTRTRPEDLRPQPVKSRKIKQDDGAGSPITEGIKNRQDARARKEKKDKESSRVLLPGKVATSIRIERRKEETPRVTSNKALGVARGSRYNLPKVGGPKKERRKKTNPSVFQNFTIDGASPPDNSALQEKKPSSCAENPELSQNPGSNIGRHPISRKRKDRK